MENSEYSNRFDLWYKYGMCLSKEESRDCQSDNHDDVIDYVAATVIAPICLACLLSDTHFRSLHSMALISYFGDRSSTPFRSRFYNLCIVVGPIC